MGCIPEEHYGVAVTGEMSIAQGQTKEQAQPQALVLQEVQVQQQMQAQGKRSSVQSVGLFSGFDKTNNHKSPRQQRCNKKIPPCMQRSY